MARFWNLPNFEGSTLLKFEERGKQSADFSAATFHYRHNITKTSPKITIYHQLHQSITTPPSLIYQWIKAILGDKGDIFYKTILLNFEKRMAEVKSATQSPFTK